MEERKDTNETLLYALLQQHLQRDAADHPYASAWPSGKRPLPSTKRCLYCLPTAGAHQGVLTNFRRNIEMIVITDDERGDTGCFCAFGKKAGTGHRLIVRGGERTHLMKCWR